ncbi:HmuY family protein [Cecembia sp.]|uniref:HmuY family protein n=1 Tax=Cecembia sp. TaxID=1898110 RepID=UPI0025BF4F69|nr:HmuY family protein [Cecembia sp.]
MITTKYIHVWIVGALAAFMFSCGDSEDPILEVPPVEEGEIEINGGGTTFPNSVFINLSKEEQLPVRRDKWDLAFSTGTDFKVLINGTTGALAYSTGIFDLNTVGEEQAEALRSSGRLEMSFTNMEAILSVDLPSNPLSAPVMGTVNSTSSSNQVFILNRGSFGIDPRPWKKIRILVQDGKYLLQHADISSTSFSTLEVSKDKEFNFIYVSFDEGIVEVEPKKGEWDFMWSAGTSITPFPQAVNGTLAYPFQDLVFHNIYGNVGAVQIMEADIAYENFTESNLSGLEFNIDNRLTIGSNWRGGGGPNVSPTIRNDRYYILRDSRGNIYKVRFIALTRDGERGRPTFEFKLVKGI